MSIARQFGEQSRSYREAVLRQASVQGDIARLTAACADKDAEIARLKRALAARMVSDSVTRNASAVTSRSNAERQKAYRERRKAKAS